MKFQTNGVQGRTCAGQVSVGRSQVERGRARKRDSLQTKREKEMTGKNVPLREREGIKRPVECAQCTFASV